MRHDNRTKPQSAWTYYVVDNVPRMSNIYYYDTLMEAMRHYQSLPKDVIKALGSSKDGLHEIDHIHCRNGQNVLVMDCQNLSPWKDNGESRDAIDTMIAYLNVQYQLSSMFGPRYPSVIVELDRYKDKNLENYFRNKLLRPEDPKYLVTSIKEVFVEGAGWLKRDAFLKRLDDSRPPRMGEGAKSNFVTRLNIDYIDETGHCGQADLSTKDFVLLQEKTAREVSPEKLAADLLQFAEEVDPYEAMDQEETKDDELHLLKSHISSGMISPYVQQLRQLLSEGLPSEDDHKKALSLLSRLTVLTPPEFRKPSLETMICKADFEAKHQSNPTPQKTTDKER